MLKDVQVILTTGQQAEFLNVIEIDYTKEHLWAKEKGGVEHYINTNMIVMVNVKSSLDLSTELIS